MTFFGKPVARLVAAVHISLGLVASSPASAQTNPPMTGEFLSALTPATITSGNCDPAGNSTLTFTIAGIAAGPYPGTFVESGRVVVGPQIHEVVPGQFYGDILAFDADFTITGATGTVTGTKTFAPDIPANGGFVRGGCLGEGDIVAAQILVATLRFSATVNGLLGTSTDQGQAWANFNAYVTPHANTVPEFRQAFTSTTAPPPVDNQPATVSLTPEIATNPIGTQHCVTATVKTALGSPVSAVAVHFTVAGASNASATATTNASGQAGFCYPGPLLPGQDVITAFVDANGNGEHDLTSVPPEPSDQAAKTWVVPTSTPGCKVTFGGSITTARGDRATFGGVATVTSKKGTFGETEYTDHGRPPMKVKSIHVLAVVCTESEAVIYGEASVNGNGPYVYRIRVTDAGQRGSDTYGILVSSGYYSGEQPLRGGNVQIHR